MGLRTPAKLIGGKGYRLQRVREWLAGHSIEPVISRKRDELGRESAPFDKRACRKRNLIERCAGRLETSRRLGTRLEKPAARFLAKVRRPSAVDAFVSGSQKVLQGCPVIGSAVRRGGEASGDARHRGTNCGTELP